MSIGTRDLIPVTEASNRGVSKLIADAEGGRLQVVSRNGRPVAAVVNIDYVNRLDRIDELEDDLRLLSIALVRAAADSGKRYTLEEAAKRLGIDLAELED